MNNFPKGNDLIVKWAIKYSDGTPFPLENYAWELCYSAGRGINVVKDTAVISVSDNLLTWRFSGKDQVFYGKYSLTLRLYQQGKIVATVSKNNAFELSTTQYDGSCDIDLVSYCDNISLQDALLRGNKAMEVAQDAKVIAGSAVNTAGAAVTTANEAKSIANTANATSTEAKTIAGNAKTVADQAKTTADAAAATATQKAEEVAQKEAQLEAALNNLSPDQSGALALSTKVNEHGEKLSELNEKVDALALGAFYGYFPDSSSLPVDVTTPGYAYVGSDNPYEIWNFNGESWSDSGTYIDMNDADEEDITRNADGKLQFKGRPYGDGMGYVILRKGKTFAEQVTQANTIYEIRYDFDLNGEEVEIPVNCVLKFNGGQINNGAFIGSFDISGIANLSSILYKTTGAFGEKSCTMKFSGVIDNSLLPTYTECRFASQYNVPVIINKKYGTPTRYGGKGNATTDCSDAIQCLFDVLSYDGGDADFSRLSNDGIGLFKITRQLVVKSTNAPSQGYKARTALGKIFGDAGSDYTNIEDNNYASSIIAYGLKEFESAIFFSGYSNGWPVGTSISGMKIIANDASNDDLSFAFKGTSLISNLFSQCQFIGKNGVLANARDIASTGGYSLILVKWDSCKFSTTLKDRGYAYTSGFHLLKGVANNSAGDIALFENCNFEGTVECNFNVGTFLNCMWRLYNLATKLSGTIAELGLTDKSFTTYPNRATIDYGACINIVNLRNLTIQNCYYEDHNGIFNISADYPTGALNIKSCYLNGITNQAYNNSLSKYVIKIEENYQYNSIRPSISLDKCFFRIVSGDKTGFSEGVVVNNSDDNVIYISDFSCSPESKKHLIEDNVGIVVINGSKPKFRFGAIPVTAEYSTPKPLISYMYQKDYIPIYYPSVLDNIYILINGITKNTTISESEECGFVSFVVGNTSVHTINFKQSDIIDGKIELSLPTQESINSTTTFKIGANSTFGLIFQGIHIEEFVGANMNVVVGIE